MAVLFYYVVNNVKNVVCTETMTIEAVCHVKSREILKKYRCQ